MQQLLQRAKIQPEKTDKKHPRSAEMNCKYCERYFVDPFDGLAVYCFHEILHGEIQL